MGILAQGTRAQARFKGSCWGKFELFCGLCNNGDACLDEGCLEQRTFRNQMPRLLLGCLLLLLHHQYRHQCEDRPDALFSSGRMSWSLVRVLALLDVHLWPEVQGSLGADASGRLQGLVLRWLLRASDEQGGLQQGGRDGGECHRKRRRPAGDVLSVESRAR